MVFFKELSDGDESEKKVGCWFFVTYLRCPDLRLIIFHSSTWF